MLLHYSASASGLSSGAHSGNLLLEYSRSMSACRDLGFIIHALSTSMLAGLRGHDLPKLFTGRGSHLVEGALVVPSPLLLASSQTTRELTQRMLDLTSSDFA